MVKPLDGISRATPKTIITPPANISSASVVVNQPVAVNHIAPAVAVNNVAQKALTDDKKLAITTGALIGEAVIGGGCTVGAVVGAVLTLEQMGATTAVMTGAGAGVVTAGVVCTVGAMVATAVPYCLSQVSRHPSN